jgi:hypothetical protein
MNILKRLTLLIIFLMVTGCASFGPTLVIETPEPAEDFVVICEWHKRTWLSGGHGGKQRISYKVNVVASDEEVDCGMNLTGGDGSVDIWHPVYMGAGITAKTKSEESDRLEMIDGVMHIKMNKTKLDILDEQKAKFEAGYWDRYMNPGAEYARSFTGCSFPHQYFDYYSEAKKVDVAHFKQLYHKPILECFNQTFPIRKQYLRGYENYPTAEDYINGLWKSDTWSKYK